MLVRGHSDLTYNTPHPLPRPGSPECATTASATFRLRQDVSSLFPYINAQVDGARYTDRPARIQFALDGVSCTLHPHDVIAVPFCSIGEAHGFAARLVAFLNDLHARMDSITPDHRCFAPVSALSLFRTLPQTNCGLCGHDTCMAFAVSLGQGRALPMQCPQMPEPISTSAVYPIYDSNGALVETVALEGSTIEPPDPGDHRGLTAREIEVLRHLARGRTNAQIAERLGITLNTVKSHVTHIFNKLAVDDRTEAAVWAVKQGLVR